MTRETWAHHAMAAAGGFFGVYALLTRGGTFGSSETSNLIYLVVSGLDGTWGPALIRLGGTACYIAGIVFAVLLRRYGRRPQAQILSISVDFAACLLLAWIPAETDPILALYPMFFATAVQWVSFSQAAGYNCATIFSTNNLRQFTEGVTEFLCTREAEQLRKLKFYGGTLACFHLGVAWGWWCTGQWGIAGIYGCLPLLAAALPAVVVRESAKA
ncbi:YoaK family protein [uncultured Oscillibacter sp.]|uniref:YoaK family protein n=1 Tax=uncultured Oscillibacter sp. TaxID=876091 RepID=UPI0025E56267|nr:YoaK family protein [uncultured Oscillibacter sp.]